MIPPPLTYTPKATPDVKLNPSNISLMHSAHCALGDLWAYYGGYKPKTRKARRWVKDLNRQLTELRELAARAGVVLSVEE